MPTLTHTGRFSRSYLNLTAGQQSQVDAAIRAMVEAYPDFWKAGKRFGPPHQLKGVEGTPKEEGGKPPKIWDAHAPGPEGLIVITFQVWPDEIIFRNCGSHDAEVQTDPLPDAGLHRLVQRRIITLPPSENRRPALHGKAKTSPTKHTDDSRFPGHRTAAGGDYASGAVKHDSCRVKATSEEFRYKHPSSSTG